MKSKETEKLTLILGLGNTILTDDGVGIYVVREIEKKVGDPRVVFREACLGGLELLEEIEGFRCVVLVDAVVTGRHPIGTLVRMRVEDVKGGSSLARHQIGFSEALRLGQALKRNMPNKIIIYGIEVKDVRTFGESCTPEVATYIPKIVEEIIEERCNSGNNGNHYWK